MNEINNNTTTTSCVACCGADTIWLRPLQVNSNPQLSAWRSHYNDHPLDIDVPVKHTSSVEPKLSSPGRRGQVLTTKPKQSTLINI